jgi:hypothetical protein
MTLGWTILFLAVSSVTARGAELPELRSHLTEMIDATEGAVNRCESSTAPDSESGEAWYYRRFWLRFRPRVAFAIPGFAKLEIVPEFEMLWARDLPTGWEVYKPN